MSELGYMTNFDSFEENSVCFFFNIYKKIIIVKKERPDCFYLIKTFCLPKCAYIVSITLTVELEQAMAMEERKKLKAQRKDPTQHTRQEGGGKGKTLFPLVLALH